MDSLAAEARYNRTGAVQLGTETRQKSGCDGSAWGTLRRETHAVDRAHSIRAAVLLNGRHTVAEQRRARIV